VDLVVQRVHPEDRALANSSSIAYPKPVLGSKMSIGCYWVTGESSTSRDSSRSAKCIRRSGVCRAVTDITERKAAEEKDPGTETELRQMLDFAPQLIAVYGPNRERLYANRVALEYAGVGLDEWRRTQTRGVHSSGRPGTGARVFCPRPA